MQIVITNRNKMFWMPPSMEYLRKAFLPKWIHRIRYTSITPWAKLLGKLGGLPISHLGKSRLKFFQMHNEAFKIAAGGTSGGVWADMPTGPTYALFNKIIVKKSHRCGNEGTSES